MSARTFKKNADSEKDLPPWMSRVGSALVQDKWRCWDGLNGCEEYHTADHYRWHPRICTKCTAAMCNRFQFSQKDIDILTLLLWQESGLYKSVKKLKGNQDKLDAMIRTETERVIEFWRTIQNQNDNREKIAAASIAYRKWFYDQVGLSVDTGAAARGFTSMAASV